VGHGAYLSRVVSIHHHNNHPLLLLLLLQVCGYPKEGSCAVVDVFYIDHLDKKTASGFKYRGRDYWQYGFDEWAAYERVVGGKLKSPYQRTAGYFSDIKEVPRPPGWAFTPKRSGGGSGGSNSSSSSSSSEDSSSSSSSTSEASKTDRR